MEQKLAFSLVCLLVLMPQLARARVLTDLSMHDGNTPTFRYSVDSSARVVQERCAPDCVPFLDPIPLNDLRNAVEIELRPDLEARRRRVKAVETDLGEKNAELNELAGVILRLEKAGASPQTLSSYYATRTDLQANVSLLTQKRDGLLATLDPSNLEVLFSSEGILNGTVVYSILKSNSVFPGLRPYVSRFPHLFAAAFGKRAGEDTWTDPETGLVWWYATGGTWEEVSAKCPKGWRVPGPSDVTSSVHYRMVQAYRDNETGFRAEPSDFWGSRASHYIDSHGGQDVYRYSYWRDIASVERVYSIGQAPNGGYYPIFGSGMYLRP